MSAARGAGIDDADDLFELYEKHLTGSPAGPQDKNAWRAKLGALIADPNYHILVREQDGRAVSSVTVIIVPNLTHGARPYGIIENVVTHADYRKRGHARALMGCACEIAREAGCYKVTLTTGSKRESTLSFYKNCGFSSDDKTAFIRRFP